MGAMTNPTILLNLTHTTLQKPVRRHPLSTLLFRVFGIFRGQNPSKPSAISIFQPGAIKKAPPFQQFGFRTPKPSAISTFS